MGEISLLRGSESSRNERERTFIKKLGPVHAYLLDPDVINIDLTSADRIFIERYGHETEEAPESFSHDRRAGLVAALATYSGMKSLDDQNSRLAADLPFGFQGRVQAFYAPMCPGIMVVIRKYASRVFTLDDYVRAGGLSESHRDFLRYAIAEKLNVTVSGEQNSGKSTFVNALGDEQAKVWPSARSIILQDRNELRRCSANTEVLFYDVEQTRYVDGRPIQYVCRLQDLLPDTLRLRTEFLTIGETRDPETTIGLLAAANTGTRGLKTTIHSNSCLDTLDRFEDLILMGGKLPVRRAIARLAQVLIHLGIDPVTRHRRVLNIRCVERVSAGEYITEPV